ncbi:MAG: ATP-binding protein [Candidatus Pacebacteria bacterium]|nr:ATP-binding protein [Candidatus Paceibacterota bacterium]
MTNSSILRDLTPIVEKELNNDEVILIIGARQAGKTTVLRQIENNIKNQNSACYFLNLEDPEYLALLNESPKNLFKIFSFNLEQKTFVLIDEVQYLKNPANFLKYFFDEHRQNIKIIATGSSAFYLDRRFKDSLAGRKKIFTLPTLSFREFLRFKAEDDLAKKDFNQLALTDREKIIFYYQEYLIFGGYPKVVLTPLLQKEEVLKDLAYSYIKKDIFEASIKQEETFFKLLRILASQIGGLINAAELSSTLNISRTTINDYLLLMQKSFHIALVRPFYKNIRKEITKMPKIYFLDLGLRNFLTRDLKPFFERQDNGQILENALYKEILKNNDSENIKFWRTTQKQEIDFVVGNIFAYETKTNPKNFKANNFKVFSQSYPHIKLSLISFDNKNEQIANIPIKEVWQV